MVPIRRKGSGSHIPVSDKREAHPFFERIRQKGSHVFYRHPDGRINDIIDRLKSFDPEKIYLFGSWARGEQDELSDIDLVMIQKTEAHFFERLREVARVLPLNLGGVDILVYTPREFEKMRKAGNVFAALIEEEGQLIYARTEKV